MKRCPASGEPVVYLDCQECDDKVCEKVDKNINKADKLNNEGEVNICHTKNKDSLI